ncbi:MAG: gliding motility-associated C-terminal domain-containing protein [Bacteroidia bacterium]
MLSNFRIYGSILLLLITAALKAQPPLVANAGPNIQVCPSFSGTIGGTPAASGGKGGTYTYSWSPSGGLSATNVANPLVTLSSGTVMYTLTVTDSAGTTATSTVYVAYYQIYYAHAGTGGAYCAGTSSFVNLGTGNPGTGPTYSWSPAAGLSSTTSPTPVATPTVTTTYTMSVTENPCPPKSETVTIIVHQPPPVNAGVYTTIYEGGKATLHGSGATVYYWTPTFPPIAYNGTANPDVEPTTTTTYTLQAHDQFGCTGNDTVTVFVIRSDAPVIYNTFSPNGDGSNDTWYIGNIWKYPTAKLDVYNRYGKLVYSKIGYANDWDGSNFGDSLPEATYYYILDLADGSKPYKGSVTIIR